MNVDLDFFQHPKILRLSAQLGAGAPLHLLRLWAYVGKFHAESGTLKGYSPQEIEALAEWRGEPEKLLATLLTLEFVDLTEAGYKIHDWQEHCGHLGFYKKRAKSAAKQRWKKAVLSNARSIATNTEKHYLKQCSYLNVSSLNSSLNSGEEKKEENPARTIQKSSRAVTDDEWLAALKANPLYTGLDLDLEARKARAWLTTNGKGRKFTRKFFGNWLVRAMTDKPLSDHTTAACQARIQRGRFLKPCGAPSVATIGGQARCAAHKEEYERRHSAGPSV